MVTYYVTKMIATCSSMVRQYFDNMSAGNCLEPPLGNSLVLHCASLLRTIFASLARANERVHVHNKRNFPQAKLNSKRNVPFCDLYVPICDQEYLYYLSHNNIIIIILTNIIFFNL